MKSGILVVVIVVATIVASQVFYEKLTVDYKRDVDVIILARIDSSSYKEHFKQFPNGVSRIVETEQIYHFTHIEDIKGTYPNKQFSESFSEPYGIIYDSLGNDLIYESPIILPMNTPPRGEKGDTTILLFDKINDDYYYMGSQQLDSMRMIKRKLKNAYQ